MAFEESENKRRRLVSLNGNEPSSSLTFADSATDSIDDFTFNLLTDCLLLTIFYFLQFRSTQENIPNVTKPVVPSQQDPHYKIRQEQKPRVANNQHLVC